MSLVLLGLAIVVIVLLLVKVCRKNSCKEIRRNITDKEENELLSNLENATTVMLNLYKGIEK